MLCNQKCKVGVIGFSRIIFEAVSVYCDDSIGILVNYNTSWIHTEGTNQILELLGTIYNLALV